MTAVRRPAAAYFASRPPVALLSSSGWGSTASRSTGAVAAGCAPGDLSSAVAVIAGVPFGIVVYAASAYLYDALTGPLLAVFPYTVRVFCPRQSAQGYGLRGRLGAGR